MPSLRAVILAALLVAGALADTAHAETALAALDRDLSSLCRALPRATSADAGAIRERLADLWRRRTAILVTMSEPQRIAVLRGSTISSECVALAKASAEPVHRVRSSRNGRGGGGRGGPRIDPDSVPDATDVGPAPPPPMPPPPTPAPPVLEEFFPWPPPAPSDRRLLDLARFGGSLPPRTWGDVADRIVAKLGHGGFNSPGFYSAPGGFAVVPRVEQLDTLTGEALAGDERWASDVKLASNSILDGIFTVRRPRGTYRAIAFVLTNDPRSGGPSTDPGRMLQIARRWGISGAADLPQALRVLKLDDAQRLFVLLYEFESTVGGETKINSPGRWPLERHFRNAGIELDP
jgi:hypothetical protein